MNVEKKETMASRFKIFHDLMRKKVSQVLLISTSYEAWIMEEDCRLSEHIVHEYKGLNLSRPPRLTWVSTTEEALSCLDSSDFDLVIIISRAPDTKAWSIADKIKEKVVDMPVVLLTHQESLPDISSTPHNQCASVDSTFFWTGNASLLVAIIKSVEDRLNVVHDTSCAGIRVILLVEDSPFYLASLLPVLYKELVIETQAVIEDGLNEEHRLLSMRARPKILISHTFEEALKIYKQYNENILGVISDVRFPRNGILDAKAGVDLLRFIRKDRFDIPLLMASSEPQNADLAADIPACFIDKNTSMLGKEIRLFLMEYLGFGDFIFKIPDGRRIGSATDLFSLEKKLEEVPEESFIFHSRRNDFSRWLYSLAEVDLASKVRILRDDDFDSIEVHRRHLIQLIKEQRIHRQKGIIVNFDADKFDPDTEFIKIGNGSLGGKARGLAFMSGMLYRYSFQWMAFEKVDISVPQTVVVTTDVFDEFMQINHLQDVVKQDLPDKDIANRFLAASFPEATEAQLSALLKFMRWPIAVRSSSLLEDAPFKSYAGLFKTYLLANDHEDFEGRLAQLINAIKMVYASTYFKAPKAFAQRVGNRVENEKMAVIIQRLVGGCHGRHFYPSISGVAQSENYYPFSKLRPEDGVASIALGLGKAVMEGEKTLFFSPCYPKILPQRSTVDDILKHAQTQFYALKMGGPACLLETDDVFTLALRDIPDAVDEVPVRRLVSTYIPHEHRIRDGFTSKGYPVLTFAPVLKFNTFPLAQVLSSLLALGRNELGCPVEIEFAVELPEDPAEKARFAVLQIRPMTAREEMLEVDITKSDYAHASCISNKALGNTINADMTDIVYVRPERFDPAHTINIAEQIGQINAQMIKEKRKYLLIGPGRWGSADRWLGIPVTWSDISEVGAIVETVHPRIHADPSQGSHFFHNITSLGISYINVGDSHSDRMDWTWLGNLPVVAKKPYVVHARCPRPFKIKVDGRSGSGVVLPPLSV